MRTVIGVHWYNRPATLVVATEQFLEFLKLLNSHNPNLFRRFCAGANSKKKALESEIKLDYDTIKGLFGKNLKPDDFPETAFIASLWNGEEIDEWGASIGVSLGSSEKKRWSNNCVIRLPYKGPQAEFYQNPVNLKALIDLMIDYWNPELYMINSNEFWIKPKEGGRQGSIFRSKSS